MRATQQAMLDIQAVIDSGDLNLMERRTRFKELTGRDTCLNDADLLIAIACTDDDDDDLFVKNVSQHEEDVRDASLGRAHEQPQNESEAG